jgi:aryl-alcohol dehydrogenase-like predicted oxidoreductase
VQLAFLWCKEQPAITAPIVGPRTLQQLNDIIPAFDGTLTESDLKACDEINPPGGVIVNFHNTSGWMKTPIP